MAERWEYRIETIALTKRGELKLSELGAEGWRAVAMVPAGKTPKQHVAFVLMELRRAGPND